MGRARTVAAAAIAACATAAATLPATATAAAGAGTPEDTVWLCEPGVEPNPCRDSLETTVQEPDGSTRAESPPFAHKPKIDCFYVYPTVSGQPSINADLSVDPEQIAIAHYQAARFSRRCRVYAPVYRQLTLTGISAATPEQQAAGVEVAYADVLAAWRDYLRNHNRGRGVVLIGHSQGTFMLRNLVRHEIDPRPRLRRLLVSALLLGGNVTVREGRRAGGDFEHVRACARSRQTGCVVGFSTFNQTPPPDARFGNAATGPSGSFGLPSGAGYEVLCNNPAALAGGPAPLHTLARTEPFPGLLGVGLLLMYGGMPPSAPTPWVRPPDRYSGECVQSNGASVLMLSSIGAARPLNPSPDATWGLHLVDVNIALGDLIELVRRQARAYVRATRRRA